MPLFRFRLIPFIATLIVVAVGCSLSWWQLQRAIQKEAIEVRQAAKENTPAIDFSAMADSVADTNKLEYTRIKLKGEFVKEWPVYLDNRPMNGVAGMVVMMPFKLANDPRYVLVARGWLPRNPQNRTAIGAYSTPLGTVGIEGIIKAHSGHVLQLGQPTVLQPGSLVQNLDIDELAKVSHFQLYPWIIEQTGVMEDKGTDVTLQDGLLRNWPRGSLGSERHRGYAFQWLALAGVALLFFWVTGFKNGRKSG